MLPAQLILFIIFLECHWLVCVHSSPGRRLSLPHDAIDRYHVFFTFWHVSTSSDKSKPFSFGYVALTTGLGVVIPDQQLRGNGRGTRYLCGKKDICVKIWRS
jgi:hypothetical protein